MYYKIVENGTFEIVLVTLLVKNSFCKRIFMMKYIQRAIDLGSHSRGCHLVTSKVILQYFELTLADH